MTKWAALSLALLWAVPAYSQNAVTQNGTVVDGDVAQWARDRVIQDPGGLTGRTATGIGLNPFSITDKNGLGLCLNNAPTTGAFNSLCLGHDGTGTATIKTTGSGLNVDLNGSVFPIVPGGGTTPTIQHPNVLDYGADATGAADSSAAFGAACAANPGTRIFVTPGVFLWNSAQTFTSPCHFVGAGWNERNNGAVFAQAEQGTWIKITNPAIAPITFSGQSAAGTGGFSFIAFEQNHPTPGTGWSPTSYQPVINLSGVGETLLDHVYFWGIYDAIRATTGGTNGRITLKDLRGHVFHNVFTGTNLQDLLHFDGWHFWPYWANSDTQLKAILSWSLANGSSLITLFRADGLSSSHLFGLGFKDGLLLSSDGFGFSQNINIGTFYCDVCTNAVHIVPGSFSGGNLATGSIGRLIASAGDPNVPGGAIAGSKSYWDESSGTQWHIGRLLSQITGAGPVYLTNPTGQATVEIDSISIESFNQDNNGSSALFIASTGTGLSRINLARPPLTVIGNSHGAPLATANGNIITEISQSWTPGIGASGGTTAPVYQSVSGRYVIHGNTVTANGSIAMTSLGGAPTGTASITGFPSKLIATTALPSGAGFINSFSGITLTGGFTGLTLSMPPGSAVPQFLETASGQPSTQLPVSFLTGPMTIGFQFSSQLF